MQAYAEGYELLVRSGLEIDATKALSAWRQGSVVRSWLLDLFVRALEQHPGLEGIAGVATDSGEGRWTVDAAIARGVPVPVIAAGAVRPLQQPGPGLDGHEGRSPRCATSSAATAWCPRRRRARARPRRSGRPGVGVADGREPVSGSTDEPMSDALVLFGATGDLAKKKIFPAVYEMARRRPPAVPVIGFASSDWDDERLRAARPRGDRGRRAASTRRPGRAWPSASPTCAATTATPTSYAGAGPAAHRARRCEHPLFYLAIPPALFDDVVVGLGGAGPPRRAPGWWWRSRSGATARRRRSSTRSCTGPSPSATSSASTTSSARSRWRTCWCSASPTRCSSRCGTATSSPACRSPWPRSSASSGRGKFYETRRRPARRRAEPPAPGRGAARRWSRRPAPTRRAARRAEQAVPPGPHHRARPTWCAASTAATSTRTGVEPESDVETYVALRFEIDSWRWAGVPWLIRTGKHLPVTATEAIVRVQRPAPPAVHPAGQPRARTRTTCGSGSARTTA